MFPRGFYVSQVCCKASPYEHLSYIQASGWFAGSLHFGAWPQGTARLQAEPSGVMILWLCQVLQEWLYSSDEDHRQAEQDMWATRPTDLQHVYSPKAWRQTKSLHSQKNSSGAFCSLSTSIARYKPVLACMRAPLSLSSLTPIPLHLPIILS